MIDLDTYALYLTQLTYNELCQEAQRRRGLAERYWTPAAEHTTKTRKSKYYAHYRRLKMCEAELKSRQADPYTKGAQPRD
jgi:hypothetical protein